jgi:hypothetical protein
MTGDSRMGVSRDVCAVIVHGFHGGHCFVTAVGSVVVRYLGWPLGGRRATVRGMLVVALESWFHLVLHPVLRCSHCDWRRCHPMCQMVHAGLLAVATVADLVDDPSRRRFVEFTVMRGERRRPGAIVNTGCSESRVSSQPLL